jgi:hypothetical protein
MINSSMVAGVTEGVCRDKEDGVSRPRHKVTGDAFDIEDIWIAGGQVGFQDIHGVDHAGPTILNARAFAELILNLTKPKGE